MREFESKANKAIAAQARSTEDIFALPQSPDQWNDIDELLDQLRRGPRRAGQEEGKEEISIPDVRCS